MVKLGLRTRVFSILTMLTLVFAMACSSAPPATQQPAGSSETPGSGKTQGTTPGGGASQRSELRVGVGALPRSGNTFLENSLGATPILRAVFDTLVENVDGQATGRLATEWENVDPTTWEFKLREGVKFSNGEEFNAEAVKWNVEYNMDPANKSVNAAATASIDHVEVVDPLTVRIVTKEPDGSLISSLTRLPIQPPAYFESKGPAEVGRAPIGTGPYKVTEWKQDESVTLEPYTESWRAESGLSKIIFTQMPEDGARLAALEAGQIDVAYSIPPEQVSGLRDKGFQIINEPIAQTLVLFLRNNVGGPLENVKVRQAIAYAVDVDGIAKALLGEFAPPPMGQTATSEAFGYVKDLQPYPYDPEKAKQLLAEAGYPDGFTVTFETPTGRYMKDLEAAQAVAQQLAQVGINVELQTLESGVYLEKLFGAQLAPLYTMGQFTAPAFDASIAFGVFVTGASPIKAATDPKLDELYAQQISTLDPNERAKVLEEMARYVHDQAIGLVLYQIPGIYAASPNVQGLSFKSDYSFKSYDITISN